jgi:hypothetical protein
MGNNPSLLLRRIVPRGVANDDDGKEGAFLLGERLRSILFVLFQKRPIYETRGCFDVDKKIKKEEKSWSFFREASQKKEKK